MDGQLCLGAACTGCIQRDRGAEGQTVTALCLGAACTGCIPRSSPPTRRPLSLPRRCLHRVHLYTQRFFLLNCWPLPRRCLHRVHRCLRTAARLTQIFASALPAQGASLYRTGRSTTSIFASALPAQGASLLGRLTLGAGSRSFASALPAQGASANADKLRHTIL